MGMEPVGICFSIELSKLLWKGFSRAGTCVGGRWIVWYIVNGERSCMMFKGVAVESCPRSIKISWWK